MDFRLKGNDADPYARYVLGFNPCSNGLSAQRAQDPDGQYPWREVSILVLMDFRLKGASYSIPL